MNNLRRLAAVLLSLMMIFSLTATACADSAAPYEELKYLNGQLRVGMECAYAPSNWQESEPSETNVPIENVPGAYAEGYDVQWAKIVADYLGLELVIVNLAPDVKTVFDQRLSVEVHNVFAVDKQRAHLLAARLNCRDLHYSARMSILELLASALCAAAGSSALVTTAFLALGFEVA